MDNVKEEEIMELIVHGGDARSKAIEAMRKMKDNDFESARALMKECHESILIAHKVQTKLLQEEASGANGEVQLLMVHAQDHLMDAMVMRDMVDNLIDIQEKNYKMIQNLAG
jgi:PTS system cellobiose-specific IIA component